MRVLVTTPPLDRFGGVSNFHLNLRNHLGDEVRYFYIGRRKGERRWLAPVRILADYARFAWTLFRRQIDVVHLNPSLGPGAVRRDMVFLLLAKAFRMKCLVFMHGWDKEYERKLQRGGGLFRRTFLRADAFIVLAREFEDSLRAMGYSGPVEVMSTTHASGLLSHVASRAKGREDAREPFEILFLSRIERKKGVFVALEAVQVLQSRYPNLHMTIAGIGGALDEAKSFAADRRLNVAFVGYVRDRTKAEQYAKTHCCLFPTSWGEGMPITVVEAMAFGVPVITRPVGALPDFFRDGEMGFMVDSTDPQVFAELVERLILSPELCEKIAAVNRVYAAAHFAPAVVSSRLQTMYRELHAARS